MAELTELDLERRARRIEGQTLAEVHYQNVRWAARTPITRYDSVGVCLYLRTAEGRLFRISWADELHLRHGFGIALHEASVIDGDRGDVEDMTRAPAWACFVGQRVTGASLFWREIRDSLRPSLGIGVAIHADHVSRADYPQTLELTFEGGGRAYFSAARVTAEGVLTRFTNNVLVVWSREGLEQLGLR